MRNWRNLERRKQMQTEKKIVNDKNTLSYQTIQLNQTDIKFAKITSAVIKKDSRGNDYLQIVCKGRDGISVYGRMFGANVADLYKNWNKIANSICVIEYEGSEYLGEKCITVSKLKVLDPEDLALARQDLFDSVVSNLDYYLGVISELISSMETSKGMKSALNHLINSETYKELSIRNDVQLLEGKNGALIVLLANVVSFLSVYDGSSPTGPDDTAICVFSLVLCEAIYNKVLASDELLVEVKALEEVTRTLGEYKADLDPVDFDRINRLCCNLVLCLTGSNEPKTKFCSWVYQLRQSVYNFMVLQSRTKDLEPESVLVVNNKRLIND